MFTDEYFMDEALREAVKAFDNNEVPIGAVIVANNRIISRSHNQTEKLSDATAHAEILAISGASEFLGTKYLKGATLYVTLEPCFMCAGAIFWSQIQRVVYGASDPKQGYRKYQKVLEIHELTLIHPKANIMGGVREQECSKLLIDFFRKQRTK